MRTAMSSHIVCPLCNRSVSAKVLNWHICNQHSDFQQFQCPKPNCTFKCRESAHMRDHFVEYRHGSIKQPLVQRECPDMLSRLVDFANQIANDRNGDSAAADSLENPKLTAVVTAKRNIQVMPTSNNSGSIGRSGGTAMGSKVSRIPGHNKRQRQQEADETDDPTYLPDSNGSAEGSKSCRKRKLTPTDIISLDNHEGKEKKQRRHDVDLNNNKKDRIQDTPKVTIDPAELFNLELECECLGLYASRRDSVERREYFCDVCGVLSRTYTTASNRARHFKSAHLDE